MQYSSVKFSCTWQVLLVWLLNGLPQCMCQSFSSIVSGLIQKVGRLHVCSANTVSHMVWIGSHACRDFFWICSALVG